MIIIGAAAAALLLPVGLAQAGSAIADGASNCGTAQHGSFGDCTAQHGMIDDVVSTVAAQHGMIDDVVSTVAAQHGGEDDGSTAGWQHGLCD